MSQAISLWGATYSNVPSILLPKQGGGSASFTDVTDTDAVESDVASGKKFHKADGSLATGTASGGGGSNWALIKSTSLQVSTTSTTAAAAGTIECGATAWDKTAAIWVHIRDHEGKRSGYFYGSDTIFINYRAANNSSSSYSAPTTEYIRCGNDGMYLSASGSYGVYGYSITNGGTLTIRRRYNSSNTLTINSTYDILVYKLTMPTGVTLFA